MKKAIIEQYGDLEVIKISETDIPKISAKEVLVQVKAAALNPKDILVRKGKFKRLSGSKFPQGIGYDFAGIVAESKVGKFKSGDKVFGMVNGWLGKCCAEYVVVQADELYTMPANLSFEQAAGIPLAGQTSLQAIRDIGQLETGQQILINGASGGVGTLAIQIAKILGGIVTTISSSKNIAFCQSLGADHALSYQEVSPIQLPQKFEVFYDVFGNYNFQKAKAVLSRKGRYITTVPKSDIFKEQFFNLFRKQQAKMVVVRSKSEDIQWFADHLMKETLQPIVDKTFSLSEITSAQQYIESKRAKGKVVIKI